jgi:hypothetical protein
VARPCASGGEGESPWVRCWRRARSDADWPRSPPVRFGEILREGLVHGRRLQKRLRVAFGRAGVADDIEHGRRVGDVEGRARSAEDLEDALAHFRDERVDVDECLHVAAAATGIGDHDASVRVTDEDDRTGCALRQESRDVRGVSRDAAQEVGGCEHREALALELGRDGVPARPVRPRAVDKERSWASAWGSLLAAGRFAARPGEITTAGRGTLHSARPRDRHASAALQLEVRWERHQLELNAPRLIGPPIVPRFPRGGHAARGLAVGGGSSLRFPVSGSAGPRIQPWVFRVWWIEQSQVRFHWAAGPSSA